MQDEATLSSTLQWVRDNPGPGGLLFVVCRTCPLCSALLQACLEDACMQASMP